jgi:hypothetical protein
MYLYWRVQQDLSCLGEVIRFHDPSFIRCFHKWVRRNAAGLALVNATESEVRIPLSLN